jgi:hypothetical protein
VWHALVDVDRKWSDAFARTVQQVFGISSSVSVVDANSGEEADLCVVAYQAARHEDVVKGELLTQFCADHPEAAAHRIVLVACDLAHPAREVEDVEALLTEDSLRAPERHGLRVGEAEELSDALSPLLRKFVRPSPAYNDEADSIGGTTW